MPRLLLLNGPPGIGKSTLARRWVADRPLALCLDLDEMRRGLRQWPRDPDSAGEIVRRLAADAARAHLAAGHDVVVPQFLGRVPFVDALAAVAAETGAAFAHVVLMDSKPNAIARFEARGGDGGVALHHREAAATAGGRAGLSEMYDRLHDVLAARPHVVVQTRAGDVEGSYRALLAALGEPAG